MFSASRPCLVAPASARRLGALAPAALATVAIAIGSLLSAGPAAAASGFYIKGGGDGHGIGMSQYGALGWALHGYGYTQILGHYYTDTALSDTDPGRTITVLLKDGSATFSGATTKVLGHKLKATTSYTVTPTGSGELTVAAGRHTVGTVAAPLTVTGPHPLDLDGMGVYRGGFVFRPDGSGGIETVNAVDVEDYVRGVVAAEMPSSWPLAALEAQAVAARTYAITSGTIGSDFDVYDDTRSQMYGGVAAETATSDTAVADTRGQIVTFAGAPAETYFFSSSGGHTESIQNVWTGLTPEAWLTGVPDPYDDSGGNPNYRWKLTMSVRAAARRLRPWLKGSLRGILTLRTGVSPRIVTAAVVGSKGSTTVSGPQLAQAFGLLSTYASFTTITTNSVNSPGKSSSVGSGTGTPAQNPSPSGGNPTSGSPPSTGGATVGVEYRQLLAMSRFVHAVDRRALTGTVFPARQGIRLTIEKLSGHRWVVVRWIRTRRGGAYHDFVPAPARYRVVDAGVAGPVTFVSA